MKQPTNPIEKTKYIIRQFAEDIKITNKRLKSCCSTPQLPKTSQLKLEDS